MDKLPEYVANHPWLVAIAAVALVVVVVYEIVSRRDDFASISSQELIRLQNGGALVLDLRDPDSFAAGHINGARHMDSADILRATEKLRKYKEKPVIVYCKTGVTGASAVRVLASQGFGQAFNLRGGLATWSADGLPLTQDEKS
jgi:rhodanese-related sulfurtransferase